MHETQLHQQNCWITLTYEDKYLPRGGSALRAAAPLRQGLPQPLDRRTHAETHANENQERAASLSKEDLTLFTKRLHINVLRKNQKTDEQSTKGVRYFAVGEYGEKYHRPHYHIAVFGEDFSGDRLYLRTEGEYTVWRSPRLEALWPYGKSEIGALTFESAAYTAGYITKKITEGKRDYPARTNCWCGNACTNANEHYRRTDHNGVDYWLEPEFSHMSRNPGLGKGWIEKYKSSVYPHDRVIINERAAKPPRFYDNKHKESDPLEHELVKAERKRKTVEQPPERLRDGEVIQRAKLRQKPRPLE